MLVNTAATPTGNQEPLDYSAWLNPTDLATSNFGHLGDTLDSPANAGQFEVLSPSGSEATTNPTAASTPVPVRESHDGDDDDANCNDPTAGAPAQVPAKGRKRKSDAMEAPSPATSEGGTRRSSRRRQT